MDSEADILDVTKLCFEGDFDTQVESLLYRIRLTVTEVQNLRFLFKDVEQALQGLGPGLQVMPFGSIVTGLGIKTSDVDCYVALPTGREIRRNIVVKAKNKLQKLFRIFTNLFAISSAKVPIVKFLHIPTNCNCDVNFISPAGVYNSELIGKLLHMDGGQYALKLAVLIKYWSKVHRISGTNLVASYTFTLMVIFYLQLMNMLPSIYVMQSTVPPHIVGHWNMAFDRNMSYQQDSNDSLYDLMGGFFKCYANLNFEENIISPYMGRLLHKKMFTNLDDVPEQFALYKHNVSTIMCKPLKIDSPICVQDPFEHARNSSSPVYPKLAARVQALFQFAAKKFDEVPREQFLKVILTEGPINIVQNTKPKQKHVFHNKIMKQKHNPQQKIPGQVALRKCYEQVIGTKPPQMKQGEGQN